MSDELIKIEYAEGLINNIGYATYKDIENTVSKLNSIVDEYRLFLKAVDDAHYDLKFIKSLTKKDVKDIESILNDTMYKKEWLIFIRALQVREKLVFYRATHYECRQVNIKKLNKVLGELDAIMNKKEFPIINKVKLLLEDINNN